MSVAKKEEVFNHQLAPRLGEPTVGVPIKKRPLSLPDKSVASGIPLSMKPLSTAPLEMSVSPAGPGCGKESFFNMSKSDTYMINKGNGITNSQIQIQDRCNRSFTTLSMTNSNGVLLNGSNEFPSFAESARSVAPVDEPQRQKFMALDLQLASCRSGKNNNGPVVKEEKAEQVFFGFSSAQHPKNVQIESEINASSNSSIGKLPNLDLNVPFDPADSLETLPTMHENGTGMYHGTNQHQTAQVPLAAPVSTISSGLSRNIDSVLNLSNSYGLSHKCGSGDVTLDLQLKPPTRPELGVNWKGLAPAPELSLSLFGKPMTEPKDFSAPNALFNSEPAGSSKKISEEAATPGSVKSPVEKIVKLVPCNANPQNTTLSVVSGSDDVVSNRLVKKEPEEPSQQHILNEAPLLQQQSIGLVSNCPAIKTGFDLNSDIFPNNSIHNGLDVETDSAPIPAESLPDILRTETLPAVPQVQKSVKCEGTRSATPSPAEATASGHSAPLMSAKSLPLEANVPSPAVGLCESVSQQSISTKAPSCSNADYIPPASHLHSHDVTREAFGRSSNSIAETLVLNTRDHAAIDGMSQGSVEMDCSEDDGITISRRPTTDKPHVEPLGNGATTKDGINANNLCTKLQKEHDSDTPLDRSSLSSKGSMEGVDDDKRVKMKVGIVSHAGEQQGHRNEVFVNEESKDKQLLKSDKNSPVNSSDNITHDVITATGSSTTDLHRPSPLQISTSPKMESTGQSPKTSDRFEKTRSSKIKSERSPLGKQAASCSKDHAKNAAVKTERQTESEEIAKQSDLRPRDSVLSEESEFDRASSSQTNSECGKVKSASEKSDYDKSKPDSCRTSSVQNERDGQLVGHAYVNRNERWERFMETEGEKNKGENHAGRYASDMINQRRTDHRYSGRGGGSQGHPRNFRGPRMSNESEIPFADEPINGRRHPFEDDLGHLHRMPHKRRRGYLMRDMDIDGFTGREIPGPRLIEDLPDDMIEDRFFMPHSHRHHAQGDHGFIYKERSHSPAQRRGAPVHFHRGRSPEAMHRSPPLPRTERPYLPHRQHTRRHGSPPDHDERGMQRNTRPRCGIIGSHQAPEGDAFEPPFHPAQLAEFHAEEELAERRRHGERRAYLRSLEAGAPVADEEDMLPYHAEDGDMEGGGPRELDGRFRNRLGHGRARGEQQEDGYRQHRGPQGWRDGDANGSRPPKRWRY